MSQALIKRMLEIKEFLATAFYPEHFLIWLEGNSKFKSIIEEVNLQLGGVLAEPYVAMRYRASILGSLFDKDIGRPPIRMVGLVDNEPFLLKNFLMENPAVEKLLETILLDNGHPFNQAATAFMQQRSASSIKLVDHSHQLRHEQEEVRTNMQQANSPQIQLLDMVKILCSNIESMIGCVKKAIEKEIWKQNIANNELTIEQWCLLLLQNFTTLDAFKDLLELLSEIDRQEDLNEVERFLLAKHVVKMSSTFMALADEEQLREYLNQLYAFAYRWSASYIALHKKHFEQEDGKLDSDAWHFYLKVLIGKLAYGKNASVEHLQEFKSIWQQTLLRMTHIIMIKPYILLINILHQADVYRNLFAECEEAQVKSEIQYWNTIKESIQQLAEQSRESTISEAVRRIPCASKRQQDKVTDPNNLLKVILEGKKQTAPLKKKPFNHSVALEIIDDIIQDIENQINSPLDSTQEIDEDKENDMPPLPPPVLSLDDECSQGINEIEPQQTAPITETRKEVTNNVQPMDTGWITPNRFKRKKEQTLFTNNSGSSSPLLFKLQYTNDNTSPESVSKLNLHYSSDSSQDDEQNNPEETDNRYTKKQKVYISTIGIDSCATSCVSGKNSLKNTKF